MALASGIAATIPSLLLEVTERCALPSSKIYCVDADVKQLLIVANLPSANTRSLAKAVLTGAQHPDIDGVECRLLDALDADSGDVLSSDAVILGTTENFGLLSGRLKDFLERVYYPCLEHTEGLPWVLYVRAGNDGEGAVRSVERIVTGMRWRTVQAARVWKGDWRDDFLDEARELGTTIAAALELGSI